VPGLHRARPAC